MPQRYTREQDLAVLYVKLAYKEQWTSAHPAIRMLAKAMKRTHASIIMRKGNFDSLDPSVPGTGLYNAAKRTIGIWAEYEEDPKRIFAEARGAYLCLARQART